MAALKLSQNQLIASEAAASKRADAATLRAQRLNSALETATQRLQDQQRLWERQQQSAAGEAAAAAAVAAAAGEQQAVEGGLALQVAHLTARAVAAERQAYKLQDTLLQAQQVCDDLLHLIFRLLVQPQCAWLVQYSGASCTCVRVCAHT